MAHATGIGGLFFRSSDPNALGAWYEHWFGISSCGAPWSTEAGMTVFVRHSPSGLPSDVKIAYFPADRSFMLNLRVDDLTALITDLRAGGIAVETRAEWDGAGEYGRFARIHDPEGNPIELWQPPA